MNSIQAISIELQTRRRREELGIDASSEHSVAEVRRLWHEKRLEELKNRLRRQFASPDPVREASEFLFYSTE